MHWRSHLEGTTATQQIDYNCETRKTSTSQATLHCENLPLAFSLNAVWFFFNHKKGKKTHPTWIQNALVQYQEGTTSTQQIDYETRKM